MVQLYLPPEIHFLTFQISLVPLNIRKDTLCAKVVMTRMERKVCIHFFILKDVVYFEQFLFFLPPVLHFYAIFRVSAPFGKRGWKMYYCTLRELVLYLHKDEHGFRNDSLHNAIRIHHALATKASDYTKKQYVFRLQTADQAEYLFQTR